MSNHQVIPLHPGVAPGSEAWTHSESQRFSERWGDDVVCNVTRPTLTVIPPAPGTASGSALVICPGGGFHGLSMNMEGFRVAEWLAARGIACFILKYRLVHCPSGDAPAEMEAKGWEQFGKDLQPILPLAAADGLAAIGLVRGRAKEFGIEPTRVGIIGFSAGGTVAASAAFSDDPASRPDFVAPIYPQYDWAVKSAPPSAPMPMFIACATNDDLRLGPHSIRLYQDWVAAGHPTELHMYAAGGHGFGMRKQGLPSDGWIEAFGSWMSAQGFMRR